MLEISARIVAVIRWTPPRPRIPASMKSRVGRAVWRAKGLWPHWFESDGRSPGKAGLIVGSNDLACPNYTFASHARRKMGQSPRWRLPAKWNGELQGRPGCRRIPPVKRRALKQVPEGWRSHRKNASTPDGLDPHQTGPPL